jgi:hypothetical protein
MQKVRSWPELSSSVRTGQGEEMEKAGGWAVERKKEEGLIGGRYKVRIHQASLQLEYFFVDAFLPSSKITYMNEQIHRPKMFRVD